MCTVVELQEKGKRVERLYTNINEEITTLQKEKRDLKYDIDDFYAQLNAANISQQYEDKVHNYILYVIAMYLNIQILFYRGLCITCHSMVTAMPY